MSYRVVTEIRFTDKFTSLPEDAQQQEQLAALDIVTRNGGTIDNIFVVPNDRFALVHAEYPDETASMKSHLQIEARGAYLLTPRRAFTLEEWLVIAAAANSEAVVAV